ncbi:cobalamin B12-binding domain-containing protein [Desulfosporosinus fructosivorans]
MLDLKKITQALGDLDEKNLLDMLNEFIASGPTVEEAREVVAACQEGMTLVGDLYEKGIYFVGDLIFSGEILTAALALIKPVIGAVNGPKVGTMIIGTVHGDLHDMGKQIFKNMAEAAGFEVFDLGIDQPVSAFIEKVKEVNPDVVGMSGVLTLSLDSMKDTVEGLKEAGLRDDIKIIIGGSPVTEAACKRIGADAWTINAAEGVRIIQGWVS